MFFSFGYIFKEIASFIHIYVFFLAAGVVFKEIWSKAREWASMLRQTKPNNIKQYKAKLQTKPKAKQIKQTKQIKQAK